MKMRKGEQVNYPSDLAPLAPLRGEGPGERGFERVTLHCNERCVLARCAPSSPALLPEPGEKGARVSDSYGRIEASMPLQIFVSPPGGRVMRFSRHLLNGIALKRGLQPLIGPGTESAANEHNLTQVIGVVVGDQQCLAEDRVPRLAVSDLGHQVHIRIADKVLHRLQVAAEPLDTLIPSIVRRWCVVRRPVSIWKLRRHMFPISAVLENIPLANTQVLQQSPWRMRDTGRLGSTQFGRQPIDRLLEIQVGTPASQQKQHMFAELLIVAHGRLVSPSCHSVGSSLVDALPTESRNY
jgi:hypothetical protein